LPGPWRGQSGYSREPSQHNAQWPDQQGLGQALRIPTTPFIMQIQTPLVTHNGHILARIEDKDWLVDTGSPLSFGDSPALTLAGQSFSVASGYMGLTAAMLTDLIGHPAEGLIGTDILNRLDVVFDTEAGLLTFADDEWDSVEQGFSVPLSFFMEVPLIEVEVAGDRHSMFLDSGAPISYFQDESLADYPSMGAFKDFFPGMGEFESSTHLLPVSIGSVNLDLRCGSLPGLLGLTLLLAGASGIVGNQVLLNRKVAYLPRRQQVVFA
jgi:hypothetical protein